MKLVDLDVRYAHNVGPGRATASPDTEFVVLDNYEITTYQATSFLIGTPTSVSVSCAGGSTYTGAALTPCTATATAAGGFSVDVTARITYSDNTNAGTATATAQYAGDGSGGHIGSTGSTTFTIAKATSSVAVTCPPSVTYTGAYLTPCTITAAPEPAP